jgi:hypothetical protein
MCLRSGDQEIQASEMLCSILEYWKVDEVQKDNVTKYQVILIIRVS